LLVVVIYVLHWFLLISLCSLCPLWRMFFGCGSAALWLLFPVIHPDCDSRGGIRCALPCRARPGPSGHFQISFPPENAAVRIFAGSSVVATLRTSEPAIFSYPGGV